MEQVLSARLSSHHSSGCSNSQSPACGTPLLRRRLTGHSSTVSYPTPEPSKSSLIWISSGVRLVDMVEARVTRATYNDVYSSPGRTRVRRHVSSSCTPPSGLSVTVNEVEIAMFYVNDTVFATQLSCPHMGASLVEGSVLVDDVEDIIIECPLHKLCFLLKSGKLVSQTFGRSVSGLQVYPTRISGNGEIEIGFDNLSPIMFSPELNF